MKTVQEIAEQLNAKAAELAPELLPNGHKAGHKWMASGIDDTGKSASLWVHLSGAKIGHWVDCGNAAPGEERGDMLDLLRLKLGLADAKAAIVEAKRRLGIEDRWTPHEREAPRDPAELARRAAEARARAEDRERAALEQTQAEIKKAMGLFLSGEGLPGTPAEAYLNDRGLTRDGIDGTVMSWPGSLRYHPSLWHYVEQVTAPALMGAIFNAQGQQIGVQRVFLGRQANGTWGKMLTPKAKLVKGTFWSGFVPINKGSSGKSMRSMPAGEAVYVTEGIEDALALRMLRPASRIIAAVSLANIGGIVLPPAAQRLVIVADRDVSERAQDQLERAIGQQQARGLSVGLVMPPEGIKDLNDWLVAWLDAEKSNGNRQ